MQADPEKFPNGIKWLAEQLHGLGFKFGIYTSVGEKTCGGGQPGIMGHIQIDAATFASWDVDYVKVDRCGWPGELFFAPGLDVGDLPEFARIVAGIDYPENGNLDCSGLIRFFCFGCVRGFVCAFLSGCIMQRPVSEILLPSVWPCGRLPKFQRGIKQLGSNNVPGDL